MTSLRAGRQALVVFLIFASATTASGQNIEMRCRGGGFWIDTVGTRVGSTGETILTLQLEFLHTAQWVDRVPVSATHEIPGHWLLGRSACAWLGTSNGGPYDRAQPAHIWFETPANAQLKQKLHGSEVDTSPTAAEVYPDARTIPEYLRSPDHYWTFHISALVCVPSNCEAAGSQVHHLLANAHGYYKPPINLVRPPDDFKARKPNRPIDASGLSTREAAAATTDASASADAASTETAARTVDAASAQAALSTPLSDAQTARTLQEQVAKKMDGGSEPVRARAIMRFPDGTASKTPLTKCEAAKLARARNSPAAPGLEKQCAAERAIEASSTAATAEATAAQSRVTRKSDLQPRVADEKQRLKEISAELNEARDGDVFGKFADWLTGSDPGRESGVATAVEKLGPGGAARRVAPAFQPENTIAVRVRYRKEYGYKTDSSALGPVGPASCAVFSISAAVGGGSARQRNPISISNSSKLADGGDYYVCNYIASGIPLDQVIAVRVAVVGPELSSSWEGGDAAEPPTGQQRTIPEPTKTAVLNAAQPRARLSYDMVYAPTASR